MSESLKSNQSAQPEKEGGQGVTIESLLREKKELLREDAERGAVHKKLKKRLEELKVELEQQKEAARQQAKALKTKVWEAEQETREIRHQLEMHTLYGTANAQRPGLVPYSIPDPGVEKRRKELFYSHAKAWKHEMRLGVFHQYFPRPMFRETFPKPVTPEADLPKVSVVTPSFRQAEYLERTMLSVLGEKYPKLEYFVMDGGSTDGSADVIKKYEASLAGWVCERDKGASDAINKGFARATGDIMAWLNSDDLWMPGVIRYVADYFARHPEVDVVYGHRLIIDPHDNQIGHWVMPRHRDQILQWVDFLPQETMFWRRSLWEKVGAQLDPAFTFAFDWDLLVRFQKAGARIVRLPYFMGSFRVHESQKSSAEIGSAGIKEMAQLRERTLGGKFHEDLLQYEVVKFQKRAVWTDRLRRLGIRW